MSELSHRERVDLALKHQEPDRVPIDFLGHSSLMVDEAYFRLKDHLGLPVTPVGQPRYQGDDKYVCPWGIEWSKVGIYVHATRGPLEDASMDRVASHEWLDPARVWHTEGLTDQARHLYENTDYAIMARNPVTYSASKRRRHV